WILTEAVNEPGSRVDSAEVMISSSEVVFQRGLLNNLFQQTFSILCRHQSGSNLQLLNTMNPVHEIKFPGFF
ncbi:MAG: hypothetical protein QQN46_09245, partial [Nitrosopumilus sp.]